MIKQDKIPSKRSVSKKVTKARRSSMVIKVLSFNIQKNKLSKAKKQYLKLLKLEAKYYFNYLIHLSEKSIIDDFGDLIYPNSLFEFNTKSNLIQIFNYEDNTHISYELKVLSSQVKQELLKKLQSSIKALSAAKTKGRKTGKIKYKSLVNIPFKQFNNSFYLSDNCKKLSLQGNKKSSFHLIRNKNLTKLCKELKLRNNGKISLKKLIDLKVIEIANAEIVPNIKKDTYSFNLTVYFNSEYLEKAHLFHGTQLTKIELDLFQSTKAGLDAGIASEATLNCGETYCAIEINSRKPVNRFQAKKATKLKRYQRKFNRNISKSKKHKKNNSSVRNNDKGFHTRSFKELKTKIDNIQSSMNNHKLDTVRKLDSILSRFKNISFQDEMVKSWHANKKMKFSSQIQKGILGKTYAKLKNHYTSTENIESNYQYKQLSKRLRTTKTCICGVVNKTITLKNREFFCLQCVYHNDRDIHSSYIINNTLNHMKFNMEEYMKAVPGCGTQPVEQGDLLLDSNLGQTTTTMKTELVLSILSRKLKSNNLLFKLNSKIQPRSLVL